MPTSFRCVTNIVHRVTPEARIVSAIWRHESAPVGRDIEFDVRTVFVGYDAEIHIVGMTASGIRFAELSGTIRHDRFCGRIRAPERPHVGDVIYFIATLPGSGIQATSDRITLVPTVTVDQLSWNAERLRRDDQVLLSARVNGCADGTHAVIQIFEAATGTLSQRVAVLDAIIGGGRIAVPWAFDDRSMQETPRRLEPDGVRRRYIAPRYFFTVTVLGQEYGRERQSGLIPFRDTLRLTLKDDADKPVAHARYKLCLADGSVRFGALDAQGSSHEDDLPPGPLDVCFIR